MAEDERFIVTIDDRTKIIFRKETPAKNYLKKFGFSEVEFNGEKMFFKKEKAISNIWNKSLNIKEVTIIARIKRQTPKLELRWS